MASLIDNPERNKHTRILRLPEVMDRTGESRSNIYRLDKKGILLRAKQLDGSSSAGWLEDSVDALIEARRPDPLIPSQSAISVQARASKAHAMISRDGDDEGTENLGHRHVARSKNSSTKAGEIFSELQVTSIMIMGNKVYFHAPSGKLFMEVGKAPAFLTGINIAVAEETMADANRPNVASNSGAGKRRAASL